MSGQSAAWARCPRPLMHSVSQSKEELAGNAKKQPHEIWLGFIKAITSSVVKHAKRLQDKGHGANTDKGSQMHAQSRLIPNGQRDTKANTKQHTAY